MSAKIIKVRHSVSGDIRRLALTEWPDLHLLDLNLRNTFGPDLPSPYTLRYTDQDGDQISITSNLELREAIDGCRGGILVLTLSPATSAAASISFASPPPSLSPQVRASTDPYTTPSWASPSTVPSPHAIQTGFSILPVPFPDMSVTTSQAHDTLFIDDVAPEAFKRDFMRLVTNCPAPVPGSLIWEQIRDTLINFGGDITKATEVLVSASASRPSIPTSRYYFSVSFARAVQQLVQAGFPLKQCVDALIRNGGVATNAALELSAAATQEHCPRGHLLEIASYNIGNYHTGWFCDRCKGKSHPGQRWFCMECKYDVCFKCIPKPTALVPPALVPQPTTPIVSDMSLPPSLLEPVRMLEAMGFTDRMKVIEALVKNSGDIVRSATQLAEERRAQEEKEAQAARAAERERRKAEAERIRQEKARAAEEQRRIAEAKRLEAQRQREIDAKRSQAAKVLVKSPEKVGQDLAYLMGMGFDTISSTTSLVNAGGDLNAALEELLRLQNEQ